MVVLSRAMSPLAISQEFSCSVLTLGGPALCCALFALAQPCPASHLLVYASPFYAPPLPRPACRYVALPLLSVTLLCLCVAARRTAFALHSLVTQCLCFAPRYTATPLLCKALPCQAFALPHPAMPLLRFARQCFAALCNAFAVLRPALRNVAFASRCLALLRRCFAACCTASWRHVTRRLCSAHHRDAELCRAQP